jgi:hypothetical protein
VTALARLLTSLLDAEWAMQSGRTRPLAPTGFVREALDLATCGGPDGIFAVAGVLDRGARTPEELVRRVSGSLPASADPWTLRVLGRMRPRPLLALPAPAPEPEPEPEPLEPEETIEVTSLADLMVLEPEGSGRRRSWAVAGAGFAGVAFGIAALVTGVGA